jgi:hypothetical protein
MAQYSAVSNAVGYRLDNTAPTDISDREGIFSSSGQPDRPRSQPSLVSDRKSCFLRFAVGILLFDYKLCTYNNNNNNNKHENTEMKIPNLS